MNYILKIRKKQRSMAVATDQTYTNMYHFNKTVKFKLVPAEKNEYYENGRRYFRRIWNTGFVSTEINNKRYSFALKVTELFVGNPNRYNLEVKFKNNRYLNSITAMTIYFNGQQPGYSFSILTSNANKADDLSPSMEVYTKSISTADNYLLITAVFSYQTKSYIDNLQTRMGYILKSQLYSDFKIKVGEKTFGVHKAVIAAESDVLLNLLRADMMESKTGQVELRGQDPNVVEAVLEYIYTKKCNISENPIEIFKVAHFLELEDLEEECKDYLIRHISVKNLTSMLEIASVYKGELKGLRVAATQFMKENVNALINEDDIVNSLCDNFLEMDTVTGIMQISAKCKVEGMIDKVMVFVKEHYEELFNDEEFARCIKSEPDFMLKMLKNSLNIMKI